jgi:surface polysaccharide O-acyltransferase-like enzyme
MDGDFWYHMWFMTLTFGAFLLPALASRRMERSDYITLIAVVVGTFLAAVVPAIAMFGFDKNSATYVLGGLIVIVVATVNRRFPARAASGSN